MRWGTGRERPSLRVAMSVCFVLSMLYERDIDFEVRKLGM